MEVIHPERERRPWCPPTPPKNSAYNTPGVEFRRNEKGRMEPFYTAEYLAADQIRHEESEDARIKKLEYQDEWRAKKAIKKKTRADFGGLDWADTTVPKAHSPEPTRMLKEAGIEHPGVLAALLRDIPYACEAADLTPNLFAYRWGLLEMDRLRREDGGLLESPCVLVSDEDYNKSDENLYLRAEVDRLFGDYSAWIGRWANRPQADWLKDRVGFRYDQFFAGKDIFELYCDEHLHRDLMCPWFGDRSTARELPRLYTKEDVVNMYRKFAGPNKLQEHLMTIFRGAGKSTWCSVYVAQTIVRCPDARLLLMTATRELAKELLGLARGKFVCEDFDNPTPFQALFPEHVIKPGKDSTTFNSPLRRLKQKEKTIAITSADSSSSGKHCDEGIFDDFIGDGSSESTLSLPESMKAFDKRLALIDNHGQQLVIGTPYTENDLYATQIKRNEVRKGNLQYLKVPVWHRKPEFTNVPALDLKRDMVEMTDHSGRIDFDAIWKLSVGDEASVVNFTRQYMCEPCFGSNDALTYFTKEEFYRGLLNANKIPTSAQWYSVWDLSYGKIGGDFSCGLVVARWTDFSNYMHLAVVDCFMQKLKPSLIANAIVDQYVKHGMKFNAIGIERPANFEDMASHIQEASRLRLPSGVAPYQWIERILEKDAKANRIRNIQLLTGHDPILLHFVTGCNNLELLWNQLERWTPKKKSGSADEHKDDGPDAIGLAIKWLNIPLSYKKKVESVVKDDSPRDFWGRTHAEMLAQWEANEGARENAALREMQIYRKEVEAGTTPQQLTESQWQAAQQARRNPVGQPIDASNRRNRFGERILPGTNTRVNKYGVPQK